MKVAKDRVVAIDYTIRNEAGEVVDSSMGREPLIYLHGYKQIVPGVERAIEGLEPGEGLEVDVSPEDAYGDRDPQAVIMLPRSAFPAGEELAPGTLFRAFRADGHPFVFTIIQADADRVAVDANHPLAGQNLSVEVAIVSVRSATNEELEHGHPHVNAYAPVELSSDSSLPA